MQTTVRNRGLRRASLSCLITLILLHGCVARSSPTTTPLPTPDAVDTYLMLTEKYTSPRAIISLYDVSADEAARRLRALRAITAPAGLEALHAQAIDGYTFVCNGKLLLPGSRNVLRSEALFMVEWGIGRLWDYREKLAEWQLLP